MSNEIIIIIQAKPNLSEAIAKNWDMFLEEVAGKPETKLAWQEVCSGIDDVYAGIDEIYGNNVKLDKEKRRIKIHFPNIKWYEGSKDVDSYMALFHSVKHYEDYIDAIYLRIGEDMDDMEEKYYGEGWELAYIERKINIIKGE